MTVKRRPIVLGARISTNPINNFVAGDGRYDHCPGTGALSPDGAPRLTIDRASLNRQFEPFADIHDTRYMMYWKANVSGTTPVKEKNHVLYCNTFIPIDQLFRKGNTLIES